MEKGKKRRRKEEQEATAAIKYEKATFTLPNNLEVMVLNEHGLEEFLTRQNVEWLRAVREGRTDFHTYSSLHEWKVEISSLPPAGFVPIISFRMEGESERRRLNSKGSFIQQIR